MIRADHVHIPLAAQTHAGMSGKNNEDQFAVTAFQLDSTQSTPVALAVLSDGIGGHRGGEIASEIAVNYVTKSIAKTDGSDPISAIREAIQIASDEIHRQSELDSNKKGMGATCACAMLVGNRLYTATVGDSRIYLIRDRLIRQLSTDHTWIQEMLEAGVLKPEEVEGHPNAHVIRRYLGSATPPKIDFRMHISEGETDEQQEANQGIALLPGDILMLCSDGLTDLVEDDEILEDFRQYSLDKAASELIALANQRGGHDNITIVAMRIPEPVQKSTSAFPRRIPWKLAAVGCGIVLLLGAIGTGVAFGWLVINQPDLTRTPTLSTIKPVQLTSSVATGAPNPLPKPTISLTATMLPTARPDTPTASLVPPTKPPPSETPRPSPTQGATNTPWPTDTLQPSTTPTVTETVKATGKP